MNFSCGTCQPRTAERRLTSMEGPATVGAIRESKGARPATVVRAVGTAPTDSDWRNDLSYPLIWEPRWSGWRMPTPLWFWDY